MQEDLTQTITEQLVLTKTSLFGQLYIFSNNHFIPLPKILASL